MLIAAWDVMDLTKVPPEAAPAVPIPGLVALLALLALAGLVKVLQLESLVAAELPCLAVGAGKTVHFALLMRGAGELCILQRMIACLLLHGLESGIPPHLW